MSLTDYTTEELECEVARRRGAEVARVNRLRKSHYAQKCSRCMYNMHGFCSETCIGVHLITGCMYFKEDRILRGAGA
jgi:nitrate reductase beta subunit